MSMHERQARQDLLQNQSYRCLGEVTLAVFDQLVEVLLHVFEHEIENIVLADDLFQLDYVGVGEFLQGLGRKRMIS